MKTSLVLVLVISLFVLGSARPTKASDDAMARSSLKGLNGVAILIEDLSSDEEAAGLTKDTIQTDVELRLRETAIRVLPDPTTSPYLYIRVMVQERREVGLWYFSVKVDFDQDTQLVRDPRILVTGSTWDVGILGSAGKDYVANGVRSDLKDCVDKFINAYLSVNPK